MDLYLPNKFRHKKSRETNDGNANENNTKTCERFWLRAEETYRRQSSLKQVNPATVALEDTGLALSSVEMT